MTSVNVVHGFKNTGASPVDAMNISVERLLTGKGAAYASRRVDLRRRMVRLGPEARREMDQTMISFGSISNRGRAVIATSHGVLAEICQLDAAKKKARTAKEDRQARASAARASRAAPQMADEGEAELRRKSPGFPRRKEAWLGAAKRQRDGVERAGE